MKTSGNKKGLLCVRGFAYNMKVQEWGLIRRDNHKEVTQLKKALSQKFFIPHFTPTSALWEVFILYQQKLIPSQY